MALSHLLIKNFRNLEKVELQPLASGFNFFYGENGSGKTSLLEAIYYLGHRRSFRSQHIERLIRYGDYQLSVFSKVKGPNDQDIPLGIEKNHDGSFKARLNGQDIVTTAELAKFLPMRLIDVHSHSLIEGSPTFRRNYLDWGSFYQNSDFQAIWFKLKKVLKQRNAALKRRASISELNSWTEHFYKTAIIFHRLRLSYLGPLLPLLKQILSGRFANFYDISGLSIEYHSGWDETCDLKDLLYSSLERDIERGHTYYGPHRADLALKINGIPVKDVLSTGQQKLLVCGMILAQGALLAQQTGRSLIYLVDDLPSELDSKSRHWLAINLAVQKAQVFVTAVEQQGINEIIAHLNSPIKMFHVKHGKLKEVEDKRGRVTDNINVPRETST